ncbi:MAG: dihydropteroate synthase [Proteobacteria bacterium]|nr:dihydropteroate synthase [Pseudomonadota bacterium]
MVMGVLNVTPDSFSDGGRHLDPEVALGHGLAMAAAGADIIDVGGESSRPGSDGVDEAVEIGRVRPVIEQLAQRTGALISIDTQKAGVAEAALDAGARIINDVSALRSDPRMTEVARRTGASVILMHMLGRPRDMQRRPVYDDVTAEVRDFLAGAVEGAVAAGLDRTRLAVDPGIGFGKTFDHNLTLINRLEDFRDLGRPLVLGVSRKAFIGAVTGREPPRRTAGSLALAAVGVMKGAAVIRAHDVSETVDVVKMVRAVLRERT